MSPSKTGLQTCFFVLLFVTTATAQNKPALAISASPSKERRAH
jgi:hypothetical protein